MQTGIEAILDAGYLIFGNHLGTDRQYSSYAAPN